MGERFIFRHLGGKQVKQRSRLSGQSLIVTLIFQLFFRRVIILILLSMVRVLLPFLIRKVIILLDLIIRVLVISYFF